MLRLTLIEILQQALVALCGIAFHDLFNRAPHILVFHPVERKLNILSLKTIN